MKCIQSAKNFSAVVGFVGLALLVGCEDIPNPSCQNFTASFYPSGDLWKATETIPNVVSADYFITKIKITDSDGWEPEQIILFAPVDSGGHTPKFYYPSVQGGIIYSGNDFDMITSGGSTVFEAENVVQHVITDDLTLTPSYYPVDEHLGNWTIEIVYDCAETSSFTKEYTICWYWSD